MRKTTGRMALSGAKDTPLIQPGGLESTHGCGPVRRLAIAGRRVRRSGVLGENIELVVPNDYAGWRLDRYLAAALPQFSRSRLQALIRAGEVALRGRKVRAREIVRSGDLIRLGIPPAGEIEAKPEEIPLEILFEDDDLLVLNKPAALVVHPGAGNQSHTLVNALLHHCPRLSGIGGKQRPGIVHRLDKDTTGCLVVAKNDLAHQVLARQFAEREVTKIYLAIVSGTPRRPHGTIEAAIGRHPVQRKKMQVDSRRGRTAKTEYRVLLSLGQISLMECVLHSGRTHQIRVHLHHLGHPVIGDAVYGRKETAPRQMLHAWRLGFSHPRTEEPMLFEAPIPQDFQTTLNHAEGGVAESKHSVPGSGGRVR